MFVEFLFLSSSIAGFYEKNTALLCCSHSYETFFITSCVCVCIRTRARARLVDDSKGVWVIKESLFVYVHRRDALSSPARRHAQRGQN